MSSKNLNALKTLPPIDPNIINDSVLAAPLREAQGIIEQLNTLGETYGLDPLPLDSGLVTHLAYAIALMQIEKQRAALLRLSGKEIFNDRCAALGVYLSIIQTKANDSTVGQSLDQTLETLRAIPSNWDTVRARLRTLQTEICQLIERV